MMTKLKPFMKRLLSIVAIVLMALCVSCKKEVSIQSIQINPNALNLEIGQSQGLSAIISPKEVRDYKVEWSSSNESIAKVTLHGGWVTAVAEGSCVITAKAGSVSATCSVSVSKAVVPVTFISLSTTSSSVYVGESFHLTATVLPEDATERSVSWSSSNTNIVTVDDGVVTGVSEGFAYVYASAGGKMASCAVHVENAPIPVSAISLDRESLTLYIDESQKLTATVLPDNASDKTVSWTSSNPSVASVDDGLVSAVSAGEATITATAGEFSASCTVSVPGAFTFSGMCMEAINNGVITIENPNQFTIEYKVEKGEWLSANNTFITIPVNAKGRVWLKGRNEAYTTGNSEDGYKVTTFHCYNSDFYLYGNLMSLIYGDEFEGETVITGEKAFYQLFQSTSSDILNHPTRDIELPATTLSPECYRNMFCWCRKLTRAPKLPAQKLEKDCYAAMFSGCRSLTVAAEMGATEMAYGSCRSMYSGSGIINAPELPARKLARACYEFMFMECPDLTKAMSVLPATELAEDCYSAMFQRSAKLTQSPILPATELVGGCYSLMFNGCSSLEVAPELPATTLAYQCYCWMFRQTGLKTAPELPATNLDVMCYYKMFEGCTSLTTAPVLPATTLALSCYEEMFNGCSSLNYIKMMATKYNNGDTIRVLNNSNISSGCSRWVTGVAANGTFVKNSAALWNVTGENAIPEGWIVEDADE